MAKQPPKPRKRRPPKPPKGPGRPPPPGPPAPPAGGEGDQAPLSDEEQRFVEEYLIDRNATRAYLAVNPGVRYCSARSRASEFRARPNVAAEIRAGEEALRIRAGVRADTVLRELVCLAFSDVVHLVDHQTGRLLPLRCIPREARKSVASIEVLRERTTVRRLAGRSVTTVTECLVRYKLWNKIDALDRLCNYLGLKTAIPSLEALLAALPPPAAAQLRAALAAHVNGAPDGSPNGTPDGRHP